MKIRDVLFTLAPFALAGCPEAPKPPPPPPPIEEPPPSPEPTPTQGRSPPPAAKEPAKGTRTVLAERKNDDSWDKLVVAGGRVFALTDVNRWSSGPMYVPAARLWSVPIGGGTLEKHMDLEGLATLAADDTWLYVSIARDLSTMNTPRAKATTGRIFRVPLAGGAAANLATNIEPRVMALDGDTIWFDGSKMPKDGSKSPSASGVKSPMAFAFDDENVYYTAARAGGSKGGRVLKMPKKGGAEVVLASGLPDEPGSIAIDATHVYASATTWTGAAEKAAVIVRVAKSGGELETIAKDQPSLRTVWVAGDHVYVLSGRAGRPGNILRVAKTGGAVETVIGDSTIGYGAIDATSLYFTSDGTFKTEPFERLSPAVIVRFVR